MQYGMVIDTVRCYGCNACAVACKLNNNLANGIWWNTILTEGGATRDTASGEWPNNEMRFFPRSCQHCRKPLCVAACPTGASQKREEDGIVIVDTELCIGCATCLTACPYDVRTLPEDEPTYYQEVALGQYDAPLHRAGKTEKCTFCSNLIDRDKAPACIQA
ncbi:MAG: 4Fe-4S dicluster domain-containing protein, partial [Coriobacteriales bacterium]|nr:4Fe-4S dicluster domain-containing protein [Coriobacteriales bacterium]